MNIRAKIFGTEETKAVLVNEKRPRGAKADKLRSVIVPRDERRRSNSRHEDRHRLRDERARLTQQGQSHEVELVNVSGGGAMVRGDFRPQLWDRVELHLGDDGSIECAVCWIREDTIGLEFAHETRLDCSPDEQAQVLREVIVRSFPELQFEGPAAPQPESTDDEQRREGRHPLIWSGVLHHGKAKTRVRVRNISSTGAMVESADPVLVGGQAILELGDAGFIPATLAWLVGDQVGLRFRSPFDMNQLARSRPQVAAPTWVLPDYLKSPEAHDADSSEHWGRLSPAELSEQLEGFLKR
jgi:hypothetical protein